jgi:hypothetical protein
MGRWQAVGVPTSLPAPSDTPPPGPEAEGPRRRRSRIPLLLGALFAVVTIALWLYAFFIYDPGRKVDELADRTFPTEAEQVCAQSRARVEALPPAESARDAAERGAVVDQANVVLSDMVGRLRELVPPDQGQITDGINLWIEDWEIHIADRAAYADALREDPDARFLETRKARRQISRAIDGFAEVNRMPSCATPTDVG